MDAKEISLFRELKKNFTEKGVIVDVGVFIGEWTDNARTECPGKKMYLVEPNPRNFEILKSKFEESSDFKLLNYGAGLRPGEFTYYDLSGEPNVRGMSGFVKREIYSEFNHDEKIIKVEKLDNLISEDDYIDFIKIDVEGYELNVLKGMEKILSDKRVLFIQYEYGGTYTDAGITMNDVIEFLKQYGYSVFNHNGSRFEKILNYNDDFCYNNLIATNIEI
jgi:FkbM family methyltransferase